VSDSLTEKVLACRAGQLEQKPVQDQILLLVYGHLRAGHRDEDDVSGFLLEFFPRIKGLMERFRDKGVPFRHYLLRTVRWHWTSYLIAKNHAEANAHLLQEPNHLSYDDSFVDSMDVAESPEFEPQPQVHQKRLVLLALKSAAYLEDLQVEEVCRRTGTDLAWLQSKVDQIKSSVESQAGKVKNLTQRQGEVYWQRLVAEDRVRREPDPERRKAWERRASLYRQRLTGLRERKRSVSLTPTHLDLGKMLGLPKGTVDSGIFHLKKELASLYTDPRDPPSGNQQPAQKTRTGSHPPRSGSSAPR
jgi:hypothetical protein